VLGFFFSIFTLVVLLALPDRARRQSHVRAGPNKQDAHADS
jgi:hypothetical protein